MSTRSGKRIHGSFHEPEAQVEVEPITKSIKKTRSTRMKDDKEVLETTVSKSKKRKNYVCFPSDEESLGVSEVPIDKRDEPVRRKRKNTLKEQNLNIPSTEAVDVDIQKPVRSTRRTKRFMEDEPVQNIEKEVSEAVTLEGKKGKKNKKKKAKKEVGNENKVTVSRKSKRKKKSSQDSQEEQKNSTMNISNMSVDSFHSAAGSPVHDDVVGNILNATIQKTPEKVHVNNKTPVKISGRKSQSIAHMEVGTSNLNLSVPKLNTPNKRASKQNSTFEITDIETIATKPNTPNERLTQQNSTFEVTDVETVANSTFEKVKQMSVTKNGTFNADSSVSKKSDVNSTFDKNKSGTPNKLNSTFDKEACRNSLRVSSAPKARMNSTYDKDEQSDILNSTFDKESKLNSTFNKEKEKSSSNKSSLVTTDDTCNLTFDKSDERISITSDDSRIENTTPVLIESSLDESRINTSGTKKPSPKVSIPTPLIREGTFTKEGPEVESKISIDSNGVRTPTKRITIATPGSTPFPFSKSGQKEKALMNVTRSIEKSRLSVDLLNPAPRMTRVMFCSPVNNPVVVAQQKRKVIKSNLKGSNKSFVFEESASPVRAAPRKRSFTHNDIDEARVKRSRLADDQQQSVDRLSRPRTPATKPNEPSTPSKRVLTPSKSKSEIKVSRTKLPNFAALHQRRFDKMESLDECQERKAKRAKQLLIPSAAITVLERSSPRGTEQGKAKEVAKKPEGKPEKRPETRVETRVTRSKEIKRPEVKVKRPSEVEKKTTKVKANSDTVVQSEVAKGLPTLDTLGKEYNRFGFKMNIGDNPFSFPKMEAKVKVTKNGLTRKLAQPSLAGATVTRKEAAKQLVMREQSFPREKRELSRKQSRTVIKGVRTNRRFELQMMMRDIS